MYDMNIPLTSAVTSDSSSTSSGGKRQKRRQLAHSCQLRLQELGYHGLAFTHTAYTGRLHATKDDADIALPWDDLLFPPSPPHHHSSSPKDEDTTTTTTTTARSTAFFGRMDKRTGMQIYRRLNIIIEESSDISRLLLLNSSSSTTTAAETTTANIQQILQKYDIVSIQPMNELVMQSICHHLLGNSHTTPQHNQHNNIHFIDIIVLEYATGSKGGYGLPYKLRKEYIQQILLAPPPPQAQHDIIFEINYATAMIDSKRRQGLTRTLLDIHIGYDSIQKKSYYHNACRRHQLLFSSSSNNNNNDKKKNIKGNNKIKKKKSAGGIDRTTTTTTKIRYFPYIISSGSRQDYTAGSDEGLLTLRSPNDINFYIQNLVGTSNNSAAASVVIGSASVERMLTHAYNRAMGVVTIIPSSLSNKRLRETTTRSYVAAVVDRCDTVTTTSVGVANNDIDDDEEEEEEEEECNNGTVASSLIDWLSSSSSSPSSSRYRTRKDKADGTAMSTTPLSHRSTSNSDDAIIIIPTIAIKPTYTSNDAIQDQITLSQPGKVKEESDVESSNGHIKDDDDDDDIEDGYIAM